MIAISSEAPSFSRYGVRTCAIRQRGVPFDVPIGVPIVNPFVEKRMRFKAQYKLTNVTLEEVSEAVLFGDFRSFMDMKLETFSRKTRRRHVKLNPFTKKMEEILGGKFGALGVRVGHAIAAFMVWMLGLVEWEMIEEPVTDVNVACIDVEVTSRFFHGHFKFRMHREADGVVLDDDWLPEGGGDVRTKTLPMAWLVLTTHPVGFRQVAQRAFDEIVKARTMGLPYKGEIPPSEEIH